MAKRKRQMAKVKEQVKRQNAKIKRQNAKIKRQSRRLKAKNKAKSKVQSRSNDGLRRAACRLCFSFCDLRFDF
jgi:septal ring factor EnvC (AmiA/AmiB activator)